MGTYRDALIKADAVDRTEDLNDAIWAEKAMSLQPNGDVRYFVGRFEQACKSLADATGETRDVWMTRVRVIGLEQSNETA